MHLTAEMPAAAGWFCISAMWQCVMHLERLCIEGLQAPSVLVGLELEHQDQQLSGHTGQGMHRMSQDQAPGASKQQKMKHTVLPGW